MAFSYNIPSDIQYGQVISLGQQLYINTIDLDVITSEDITFDVYIRTSEYQYAYDGPNKQIFDRLENLNNFTTVYGSWGIDSWISSAQVDKKAVIATTYNQFAFVYYQETDNITWSGNVRDFIIDVDMTVYSPFKRYYGAQKSTIIYAGLPSEGIAYPTVGGTYQWLYYLNDHSVDLTVGDVVRAYNTDGTYEELTIATIHPPGNYYSSPGYFPYSPYMYCTFTTSATKNYSFFGSYLQLVERPSGNPGGSGYVGFGYIDGATEFYVAGFNISTQKWEIGRYNPTTSTLIIDTYVVDYLLSWGTRRIKVNVEYDGDANETTVYLIYNDETKLSYIYPTIIVGKVGMAANNSRTYFNDFSFITPSYEWTEWDHFTNTSVLLIGKRASIAQMYISWTKNQTYVGVIPRLNSITFNGTYNNCYPSPDDLTWGDSSSLPWYAIDNGKTIGLPSGKYVQLRLTIRV